MGFYIPAKKEPTWGTDLLKYALSMSGQRLAEKTQEEGQALEEKKFKFSKKKEKRVAAGEDRALTLEGKRVAQAERTGGENIRYQAEQTLASKARRALAAERADLDRKLGELQRLDLKQETTIVQKRIASIERAESLGDMELLDKYVWPEIAKEKNKRQMATIAAQRQQMQAYKDIFDMKEDAAKNESMEWNRLFGEQAQEIAGSPYYSQYMAMTQQFMSAPQEAKAELLKQITDVGVSASDFTADRELKREEATKGMETAIQQRKELSTEAAKDLMNKPEAFYSQQDHMAFKEAYRKGEVPIVEEVSAGLWALTGAKAPWEKKYRVIGIREKEKSPTGKSLRTDVYGDK